MTSLLLFPFRSSESDFHYIKSYCPYQNIKDQVFISLIHYFYSLLFIVPFKFVLTFQLVGEIL